jgi:hypothetical protein
MILKSTLKSAAFLMRTLVVAAIVSQTYGPIASNLPADTAAPNQARTNQPASTPMVVAQGRCFNGKCY